VIDAGTAVTRDVDPYTVVAGVPAKAIRKKFSDEVLEEVEDLKWWDMEPKQLQKKRLQFLRPNREKLYI